MGSGYPLQSFFSCLKKSISAPIPHAWPGVSICEMEKKLKLIAYKLVIFSYFLVSLYYNISVPFCHKNAPDRASLHPIKSLDNSLFFLSVFERFHQKITGGCFAY